MNDYNIINEKIKKELDGLNIRNSKLDNQILRFSNVNDLIEDRINSKQIFIDELSSYEKELLFKKQNLKEMVKEYEYFMDNLFKSIVKIITSELLSVAPVLIIVIISSLIFSTIYLNLIGVVVFGYGLYKGCDLIFDVAETDVDLLKNDIDRINILLKANSGRIINKKKELDKLMNKLKVNKKRIKKLEGKINKIDIIRGSILSEVPLIDDSNVKQEVTASAREKIKVKV